MQGYRDPEQVYLADYGLSYRYCPDGVHKEYKENPRKGHNGTIEYTSLDAHKGLAPSRRGDLQILGFCLLHWLCGSLPWDNVLKHPSQVQEAKARLMDNLPDSVQQMSVSGASTDEVASFLLYVKTLDYQDKPDYQHLKELFASAVSGRLDFSMPGRPVGSATKEICTREKRDNDLPAVIRSLRPRIVRSYEEDNGEKEEDDEEEDVRTKHIPARYLRGPPKSTVTQPKQRTKSKETSMKTDYLTFVRHKLYPQRREHIWMQSHSKRQAHMDYSEEWDERLHHRAGNSHQQSWNSQLCCEHHFCELKCSVPRDPRQEATPTQRDKYMSWFVYLGVFILFTAVWVFIQTTFKPL
ncbi:uncharacterized protein [Leuresthes tenuis]